MPPMVSKDRRYGRGRMGVIALRDTIRAEMDRGMPLRQIYEEHQAKLEITYAHFTKVVRRYVDAIPVTRRNQPDRTRTAEAVQNEPMPAERTGPPPGSKEWRHLEGLPDPSERREVFVTRVPNDDELFGPPKK